MSKALPIAIAVILGGAALVPIYYASQHPTAPEAKADKNASPIQKMSYALGYQVAVNAPAELDSEAFIKGIRDARNKKESAYSEQDLQAAAVAYQQEQQAKVQGKKPAQVTPSADVAFLAENAKQPGVKVTASGLQYKIIKEGTGKRPTATSTVKVNYKGQLINGQVFDSSYARGEPVEFPLNRVIPGWTEGLQLLKEGGKATLYVPAQLGYGEQGNSGIPANSTLIFDVELLEVK